MSNKHCFKREWEKLSEYTAVPDQDIRNLIVHALPTQQLAAYEIIAGG